MGMTYQRGAVWWVKYYRNGRPIRESSGSVKESDITGWRIPSEVLRLQWRHVDFEARVVRLDPHTTKNDEGRTSRSPTPWSSSWRLRRPSITA